MKHFLKDIRGNVAVSVAIMGIPLTLAAGAAIDYSQFARKQSSLQNVVDTAAIAVSRDLQRKTTPEIEQAVDNYLRANLTESQYAEIQNISVTIPFTRESVAVKVESKHPTALMRIAGINDMSYAPESVVSAPTGGAEIMLVLDTTGSMSRDGKIGALKVSATQFVDDMLALNATRDRVKLGIVPFARYVNVGMDNRNAPWMNVPDNYTATRTETRRDVISSVGCAEQMVPNNEGILVPRNICDSVEYGPEYEVEVTVDYEWRGCAGSRNYPFNINDSDYSFRVPGVMNTYCPNRITQLTDDQTVLNAEIDALVAADSTYITTGLVWGYRALTKGAPFDDGISFEEAQDQGIQKAIVLMSDGKNQSSINANNPAFHTGKNLNQSDQYMREACDNIKDQDIMIFTIGFGTTIPQETLDLLEECSTDGINYYNAADGAALSLAFSQITTKLSNLYLSK